MQGEHQKEGITLVSSREILTVVSDAVGSDVRERKLGGDGGGLVLTIQAGTH